MAVGEVEKAAEVLELASFKRIFDVSEHGPEIGAAQAFDLHVVQEVVQLVQAVDAIDGSDGGVALHQVHVHAGEKARLARQDGIRALKEAPDQPVFGGCGGVDGYDEVADAPFLDVFQRLDRAAGCRSAKGRSNSRRSRTRRR